MYASFINYAYDGRKRCKLHNTEEEAWEYVKQSLKSYTELLDDIDNDVCEIRMTIYEGLLEVVVKITALNFDKEEYEIECTGAVSKVTV